MGLVQYRIAKPRGWGLLRRTPLWVLGLLFLLTPVENRSQAQSLQSVAIQNLNRGNFLVSTKQLDNSSFQKTVILLTHYSKRGATGLAINRESPWRIKDVFPHSKNMQQIEDKLFLGGPVQPDAVFVLLSSAKKIEAMQQISPKLYFSAGAKAVRSGFHNNDVEKIRAFAGYSGWAPGQLEHEISRGDWLVIDSDPQIIFQDHESLWKKLFSNWSGNWI